ncbi:tRNA 2-selenouridine(34) synthase MnmH [Acidovorax sp.]|uniref:tRNA 2-selenouridine(34) synthase MnmH n=1 Tax=Acidovorax sp. TaxID=1872122 RepID=UPI00261360A3|nr:tRNA 2-selenouridine(34) synthase MnmH [Acidovorax sp.]
MRVNLSDYRHIFLNDVPMMDVRAPVEFVQGAFPGVVNRPLMDDGERQQVGTCYKQKGQEAAIALGHQLVSGATKQDRIGAWAEFARAHPEGVLYCFRGGLRSQIVQQWLKNDAGIDYPRVLGGYKAMRSFLIETTQMASAQCSFVVLSGLTGTGKTEVIMQLANGLDLEGHANHRGSSFGQRVSGQPAQIDFENRLAIDLLKRREQGLGSFVLEDEGRHVGSCSVPLELRLRAERAPIVCLEDSFDARVERIVQDYVVQQCADFVAAHGDAAGFDLFAARLQESLDKLAKRLGGDRHQGLRATMQTALARQRSHTDLALHREWIAALMRHYYDPMYAYQRKSRADRIVFQGDRQAVLAYLRALPAHP